METYLNSRRVVFIALLLLIVSLLYSSTFHAPFNFDDEVVIKFEIAQKRMKPSFPEFEIVQKKEGEGLNYGENFFLLNIDIYFIQALSSTTYREN